VATYAVGVIGPHGPMGLVPYATEAAARAELAALVAGYGYTLVEVPDGAPVAAGTVVEERAYRLDRVAASGVGRRAPG
jgi:hypothetical protein